MRDGDLTYDDFLRQLSIQDVLLDAGYHLNRRDGLRYPSYVRLDNDGRRMRGDKFIVTAGGQCCFHPPEQKLYNVISFIKAHPQLFADHKAGMSPDHLVNVVCNSLPTSCSPSSFGWPFSSPLWSTRTANSGISMKSGISLALPL